VYDSLIMVDTANISARGGRISPPQLDPLVPIVTEYRYFLGILRSSRLPVHMGAVKIVCWYRDWIGIRFFEVGWKRRGVQPLHVELLLFAAYVQTCDYAHAVASLYCIALDF